MFDIIIGPSLPYTELRNKYVTALTGEWQRREILNILYLCPSQLIILYKGLS